MKSVTYKLAAYLFIVLLAAFGAIRAENASDRAATAATKAQVAQATARQVDLKGDRSLCLSENKIRKASNERDRALEQTASLVKEALNIISNAKRPDSDPNTNIKLRIVAKKAERIRTNFAIEKQSKCEERFPKLGK